MSAPGKVSRIRPAPLSVRLNARELELLRAKANGVPLSTYLKQTALGDDAPVIRRRLPPSRDERILATILAALGESRIANNLNQLARAVHSGSLLVNDETQTDIRRACHDVSIIRQALLIALGVDTDHEPPQNGPRASVAFNRAAEAQP